MTDQKKRDPDYNCPWCRKYHDAEGEELKRQLMDRRRDNV